MHGSTIFRSQIFYSHYLTDISQQQFHIIFIENYASLCQKLCWSGRQKFPTQSRVKPPSQSTSFMHSAHRLYVQSRFSSPTSRPKKSEIFRKKLISRKLKQTRTISPIKRTSRADRLDYTLGLVYTPTPWPRARLAVPHVPIRL